MHKQVSGGFSPSIDVLLGVRNGLRGWSDICGLGPDFFVAEKVEKELLLYLQKGSPLTEESKANIALGRARVVNFYSMLNGDPGISLKPADDFTTEVDIFLSQLKEQAAIWKEGIFHSLDFSPAEREIYFRVVAKSAPALFFMGFADAVPHSAQVSRLCASMANSLGGRHSEILQAAIVGHLHDPKFHPSLDLARHNLATHPVNAAAIARTVLDDEVIASAVLTYFQGNRGKAIDFSAGIVDALAVNDDSRFVQMAVILPFFVKRVSEMFGAEVAVGFKEVMERRLESHSRGKQPPALPASLHGCLSQIRLDSGLRGVSRQGWAVAVAGLNPVPATEAVALFNQLVNGEKHELTEAQLKQLKAALALSNQVLKVEVPATALMHHHQEVMPSGAKAAMALVIADPMMLSPHKVAAVYNTALIERIDSYVKSFEDNIRLLPKPARANGVVWQRAVILSVLEAADRLNGNTSLLDAFRLSHDSASIEKDVEGLRALVLDPNSWGKYAQVSGTVSGNADLKLALETLEAAYVTVVAQYRQAVLQASGKPLTKFYPKREQ